MTTAAGVRELSHHPAKSKKYGEKTKKIRQNNPGSQLRSRTCARIRPNAYKGAVQSGAHAPAEAASLYACYYTTAYHITLCYGVNDVTLYYTRENSFKQTLRSCILFHYVT